MTPFRRKEELLYVAILFSDGNITNQMKVAVCLIKDEIVRKNQLT